MQTDPARCELLKALQAWAAQFRITEDWILQAALDTLQVHSERPGRFGLAKPQEPEQAWFWFYAPIGQDPRFHPEFAFNDSIWSPPQDWKIFRSRLLKQFASQLEDYRRATEAKFKARDNLARDAEWTARYQKGEQAFEIAFDVEGFEDREQTVYRAVERFAASIGLNLRKIRRRRRT